MKKQTLWLVSAGCILIALPLLIQPVTELSDSLSDFIKGCGTGVIFAAFILEIKISKKARYNNNDR